MSKYDKFNAVEFCKKIYEDYGKDYLHSDNLNFRNMSMDDLRSYVTVFNQLDYNNTNAKKFIESCLVEKIMNMIIIRKRKFKIN